MCYRPIHIYNPVRTFNYDQPVRIAVPCGNCADCQRIKQNEWFFRSFIEFQHYRKIGGAVYFITLTYDNDHLPYFTAPDGSQQACFSSRHIRTFIKYFRIWLKRHGYMSKDIKYLICSEYGKITRRPHYHGLIFCPFHIPNFHHVIQKVWQHGFIICSKQGWEIKSVAGIRYASKYIAKDFTFYNLPSMKFLSDPEDFKKFKKENSEFFPSHWQSVHFGESFCETIMSQKDIPSYLANNRVSLWNGSDGVFPIPRYYHLKLEKYVNKEYSRLLDKVVLQRSEIGSKVRSLRLHECVIKDMSNLNLITSSFIENNLPNALILESQYNFLKGNNVQSFFRLENIFHKDLQSFEYYTKLRVNLIHVIPLLLSRIDRFRLSTYRCFLRYMPFSCNDDIDSMFLKVTDIIKNILYPSVYPPEFSDVIVPSGLSEFAHPLSEISNKHLITLCKDVPEFSDYETLCRLLDKYYNISSLAKEFEYSKNEYMRKKCKHYEGSQPVIYKSNPNY